MAIILIEPEELKDLIKSSIAEAIQSLRLTEPTEHSTGNKLLSVTEAAKILDISISTLHAYKNSGAIPFHRIGRRIYFLESEILASLKKIN